MNTGLIITMGMVAISTAVTEKVCEAFGKSDMAQWVRVGGTSLVGTTAVALAISLLTTVKKAL